MIEDSIEYAEDCARCGVETYLLEMLSNKDKKTHKVVTKVKNWDELISIFKSRHGSTEGA